MTGLFAGILTVAVVARGAVAAIVRLLTDVLGGRRSVPVARGAGGDVPAFRATLPPRQPNERPPTVQPPYAPTALPHSDAGQGDLRRGPGSVVPLITMPPER